ncbi:MAG: alpha/beta hydrolase [Planctomycetes bacterium]|nr:alpha/beta hydrolase [Planctomycetota bacterium]
MIWILLLPSLYVAIVAVLWLKQDLLVFPGAGNGDQPLDDPGAVTVQRLRRDGGLEFRIAIAEPADCRGVLLWFSGNAQDLRGAARWAALLRHYHLQVIAAEYPGYGTSAGEPGVASFLAMAEAAGRFALAQAKARGVPFLVGGISLGTFCATHVAAALPARRLVLCAPPTTMVEAAQQGYGWLPVRWLLRHRFDNHAVIAQVRCPTMIVHGEQDRIVPLAMGQRLAARCSPPATLVPVPGCGHNDLPLEPEGPVGAVLQQFLQLP